MDPSPPSLSHLLERAKRNDPAATKELFAALYRELHTMAERQLRRQSGVTLGTTTLLHETFLSLADREGIGFPDRPQFLAYASRAMRGLIIDYARARRAKKRGGEFEITVVGDDELSASESKPETELEDLREALERLQTIDPDLAELVDLHFFCGLSFVELAAMRGVSDRTIQREWRKARMLLQRLIDDDAPTR